MSDSPSPARIALRNEFALFLGLFLTGIVILPVMIYLVGQGFFGAYGGNGFADFYSRLHYELRSWQPVAWYLVLSPYLCWQLLRLTVWAFLNMRRRSSEHR
ncbi:MAG: hypothetical protein OEW68_06840 [Gammaproteobacteria bacterium]|nr:hypothetical protein [Gammaproteobacteria bacterium]MDH5213979.1 hypothetical protein [Gammaproteobacteria bacterium]